MGFTIYINEGWRWDYGGILTFISSDGETTLPIFPISNMAIWRDETIKSFHYVSEQSSFCNKSQYMLVGWAADDDVESKNNIRHYIRID